MRDKIKNIHFDKSWIKNILLMIIPIAFGIYCISQAFGNNFKNSNFFQYPQNHDGYSVILQINSEDPTKTNYNGLAQGFKTNNHVQNFVLSDYQNKIQQFQKDNVSKSFLGATVGAPAIKGSIIALDVKSSTNNGVQYTKNKQPIFNGYTSYNDANSGTNKKAFIVGTSNIKVYKLNSIIKTDQGDYKVE